jgi:hypothetical protein
MISPSIRWQWPSLGKKPPFMKYQLARCRQSDYQFKPANLSGQSSGPQHFIRLALPSWTVGGWHRSQMYSSIMLVGSP